MDIEPRDIHCQNSRTLGSRAAHAPGCRDGSTWCEDPRCTPYCRGCTMTKGVDTASNLIFLIILVGLIVIVLMLFAFWYKMDSRPKDALYPWQGWI